MKLSIDNRNQIEIFILKKLVNHNVWGAKHLSFELLQKGLPKDLRGFAKEISNGLIKKGILLSHPTSYGLQISLNPNNAKEIKEILKL